MPVDNVTTELDERYGDEGVTATPWTDGRRILEEAPLYWITTVRPDGRPHMTPLLAVCQDDAMYFCTGPEERKARNLEHNAHCIISTGRNTLDGLDVIVEGEARRVTDEPTLRQLADAWVAKYGDDWQFDVRDGAFHHDAGEALVFEVSPTKILAFAKGQFAQTRFRFPPRS